MSGIVIVAEHTFSRACLGMALAPFMRERPVVYSGSSYEEAIRATRYLEDLAAIVDTDQAPIGGSAEAIRALVAAGFSVTALTATDSSLAHSLLREAGARDVLSKATIGLDEVASCILADDSFTSRAERAPHVAVPLSQVQRRVLALFATGSSCNEIARELGVSPETVKTHLKRVRLKYRERGIHLPARSDIYRAARMSGVVA